MNLKYENLYYNDFGGSLRKFNDIIETRKQGDMVVTFHLLMRMKTQ